MAGNADANSTADDDFLLLYNVRALVAQRTHSPPEAERLIIEHAQNGHFTEWRYRGNRYIPLGQWGLCYPKFGLWFPVDFNNSTVSYVREAPPSETFKLVLEDVWEALEKLAREEREKKWEKKPRRSRSKNGPILKLVPPPPFLPPPFFQMTLVCLRRDEVLSMLRKAWLLRPSEQLPALESSASPEAPLASQQVAARDSSKPPETPPQQQVAAGEAKSAPVSGSASVSESESAERVILKS